MLYAKLPEEDPEPIGFYNSRKRGHLILICQLKNNLGADEASPVNYAISNSSVKAHLRFGDVIESGRWVV